MRGQNSAVRTVPALRCGVEHDRTGPVPKQHAGAAVTPVDDAREGLRPDDERTLKAPVLEESVGSRKPKNEAGTYRLQVECRPARDAETCLDGNRCRREGVVG